MSSIAIDGRSIPFSENGEIWDVTLNLKHRAKIYKDFIGNVRGKSLDVGEINWIGQHLGIAENTLDTDFNFSLRASGKNYDLVTCFEVLEHVMNPLNFVLDLRGLLGEGGRLFISTPRIGLITWYHWQHHFTEYKVKQLKTLFEYAGLEVVKHKVFIAYPLWWHFTGFRPLMRLMFHRNVVFELRKFKSR